MSRKDGLGRLKAPFSTVNAAHAVVRAAEALNWEFSDFDAFMRRAQHIEYGLSAEIEFATVLRWLGKCKFVHRLNDDSLSDASFNDVLAPDLLAIFEDRGCRLCTLIEVKTGAAHQLKFTLAYMKKLKAYAEIVGQPLLVAWRPHNLGFWILFDPCIAELRGGDLVVSLDLAIKNDLMGQIAGDFSVVPEENAGLRIVAKRIGEKENTEKGYKAIYEITDAYFHDSSGGRSLKLSNAIATFLIAASEYSEEIEDERIVRAFTATSGMAKAQMILRVAVGFALKDDERIHWKAVGKDLDAILSCSELLAETQQSFGTYVRYVLFQQPQITPTFVPSVWRRPIAGDHV